MCACSDVYEVACGLYTKCSVASLEWPYKPLMHFHSLSASWAQSQAKETHMVHRWKTMPVYDAELLLSLIHEDKPIHKIWNYTLNSLQHSRGGCKMKKKL